MTAIGVLLRWQHPTRGLITPDAFIGLAEETGLILPIGEWVLASACRQLVAWQPYMSPRELVTLTMSVNVSAHQLLRGNLLAQVDRIVAGSGLLPSQLKLEITESALMTDADAGQRILSELHARRICLALDDFGVGYSSLSYLHRLPVSELKIDRSFVSLVGKPRNERQLVRAILVLAEHLKLKVTAEGVENARQLRELRVLGCAYGQGYYFAPPLEADDALRLLTTHRLLRPSFDLATDADGPPAKRMPR